MDASDQVFLLGLADLESLDLALPRMSGNARRNVEKIQTVAIYHAALIATQSTSAYQLEKSFESQTNPGIPLTWHWARVRAKHWDRWSHGQSSIAKQIEKNKMAAIQRIELIERRHKGFSAFVHMPLWRYLDPYPLALLDVLLDGSARQLKPTQSINTFEVVPTDLRLSETNILVSALEAPVSRYVALSALWRSIRCCVTPDHLSAYSRLYEIWLSCREYLLDDPILSHVAGDLYRHTNEHFSALEIRYR